MKKIVFILFILVFSSAPFSYALNTDTHKALNEYVSRSKLNGFSLDVYLKDQLKIPGGIEEGFKTEGATLKAWQWLRDGGEYEDVPAWYLPYLRSVNHFYNPINKGGFTGIFDTGFLSGMPAVNWATLSQNTQSPGGYYSWADVRGYYLNALTSTTQDDRNKSFAKTFRGLGQLMHLVEDMSVPEHTRNDGHYLPYGDYENWVLNHPNAISSAAPVFFCSPLNSINSLFDIGRYNGTNPGVTAHLSNNNVCSNIGLSEFTNANFLTDDTIFSGFTYPRIQDTELWTDPANNRDYLRKLAVSPTDGSATGVSVDHLAASSLLYSYRWRYFPQTKEYLPLGLDSNVYADYSSLLLPRAVGYSSQVLQYFFRGQIDMVKDPDNVGKYLIENKSNEAMSGTFSLYYDAIDGNRYPLQGVDLSPVNGADLLPGASSASISSFTEPSDIKEKGKYVLVFKGKLGNEDNAVVGKMVELKKDKGLIVYKTNGATKTFNLETKEIKQYTGPAMTGEVVNWAPDGSKFLSYDRWSSNWGMIEGGWRGDTGVKFTLNFSGIIYSEQISGSQNIYPLIKYPSGMYAQPFTAAVSWDGEEVSFPTIKIGKSNPCGPWGGNDQEYYISRFDTLTRQITTHEKIGDYTCTYNSSTTTNRPLMMYYFDNALSILKENSTYTKTQLSIPGQGCPKYLETTSTVYDKIGEYKSTIKKWYTGQYCNEANSDSVAEGAEKPTMFFVMKDGKEVIIYYRSSGHYTQNMPTGFTYDKTTTNYIYFGGSNVEGASFSSNTYQGVLGTYIEETANLNPDRTKAVIATWFYDHWYNKEIAGSKRVYLVSDGEIKDITAENAEFQDSTFFALIDE